MYASGFLFGLVNDQSLETCGNIGAILSGRVIEVLGAKLDESVWENIRRQVSAIMEKGQ
jgi:sugar/nucleoside kinase (ribokinase family)